MTFDTGNFFEQRVEQLKMMAASKVPIALVQAKTYYGGGTWYTLDIDYAEIAAILRGDGYRGWISLEFEGKRGRLDRRAQEPGAAQKALRLEPDPCEFRVRFSR